MIGREAPADEALVPPADSESDAWAVRRAAALGARARSRWTPEAWLGLALLGGVVLAALLAPLLTPFDPNAQSLGQRLRPPLTASVSGSLFVLGTDSLGRDVLARVLYGARVSLAVSAAAVLLAGTFGTAVGLTAGYFDGWWDAVAMRVADVWQAIPYLILAIAVSVVLGPGVDHLVLVLALTTWVTFARVVRSETLAVRSGDMVLAAHVLGASDVRIILRHVFPQVAATTAVLGSLMLGSMVLFEASLSFLGLGVPRPMPSWGNMVLDGVNVLTAAWWVSFFPGLAILAASLGVNLLGDWLRDALDPRLSR